MQAFEYAAPTSVEAAVALLGADSQVLAGGTDLHDLQKEYVAQPDKVVSLTGIGGAFREIAVKAPPGNFPPSVTIGAGVKLRS